MSEEDEDGGSDNTANNGAVENSPLSVCSTSAPSSSAKSTLNPNAPVFEIKNGKLSYTSLGKSAKGTKTGTSGENSRGISGEKSPGKTSDEKSRGISGEKSPGKTNEKKSLGKTSEKQPIDSKTSKKFIDSNASKKPIDSNTNKKSIDSNTNKKPIDSNTNMKPTNSTTNKKLVTKQVRKPVEKPNPFKDLCMDGQVKMEMEQLSRRYRSRGPFKCVQGPENALQLEFTFPIEDPEFPFDVAAVLLSASLPNGYPERASATFIVRNLDIPEAVRRRIQNRMDDAALESKGQPHIREVLRVLDRNLEKWMIPLPAIGSNTSVKFIAANEIVVSAAPPQPIPSAVETVAKSLELASVGVPIKKSMATRSRFQPPELIIIETVSLKAMAGTIQMNLTVKMEGISDLMPVLLGIAFKCDRCRRITMIDNVRANVDRTIACGHCKQYMEVTYYPKVIYSRQAQLGYLRTKRTTPVDLLPSTFQATCNNCDAANLTNSVRVEGVGVGEHVEFGCRNCRTPQSILIEAISWTEIPSLAVTAAKSLKAAPLPTKPGEPLPDHGTCSHYRKSCRWFRFPCCGMTYPCDECHDAVNSHKAEWASRQICGFCSREFPISQKDCVCGESPGAVKHTAHWEGGKGTRDQTQMSRKDRKKYRNQEKTVPNKTRK